MSPRRPANITGPGPDGYVMVVQFSHMLPAMVAHSFPAMPQFHEMNLGPLLEKFGPERILMLTYVRRFPSQLIC